MVQLKVAFAGGAKAAITVFQFLNGTIKRVEYLLNVARLDLFQFLNGTIKSRKAGK